MRGAMMMAAALFAGATALTAQEPGAKAEIRPFVGASIPTGAQRDLFNDAPVFGLQGAMELKPTLHLVGTFGWVPGQNEYVSARDNVNMFAYDVGLELSMVRPLGGNWQFRPYAGIGGGGRTYAYEADQLADKTCVAGLWCAGIRVPGRPHRIPGGSTRRRVLLPLTHYRPGLRDAKRGQAHGRLCLSFPLRPTVIPSRGVAAG